MERTTGLRRDLTLFSVVCLGLNGVIGQGIFLTPGRAAELMGPAALVALLLAGVLCFLIALCFAEVGSRFQSTGGAYLYVRETFGDFAGFEVGWMTCCVAVISWATLANGFTLVLAGLVPELEPFWIQKGIACGAVTLLTVVNLRGVAAGASVVKFFTVAKLIPIMLFIGVGAFFISSELFTPFSPGGYGSLAETTLVLMYAYAGFETLVVPAGEMNDPQRSIPRALLWVLGICTTVYLAVFAVATGTLSALAGHPNPVAEAASGFLGPLGGGIVGLGVALSVFGTMTGSALVNPRRFYAMAERGDLPPLVRRIDPETRSPVPAILITWAGTIALTLTGSFKDLLVIGVIGRFAQYIPTCIAVLVWRHRDPEGAGVRFRVPLGPVVPLVALGLCAWLLANQDPGKLIAGGLALLVGVPLYFVARTVGKNWKDAEGQA